MNGRLLALEMLRARHGYPVAPSAPSRVLVLALAVVGIVAPMVAALLGG